MAGERVDLKAASWVCSWVDYLVVLLAGPWELALVVQRAARKDCVMAALWADPSAVLLAVQWAALRADLWAALRVVLWADLWAVLWADSKVGPWADQWAVS